MSAFAAVGEPWPGATSAHPSALARRVGSGDSERLVVSDDADVVVGWVDLGTGARTVFDHDRAAAFHAAVDDWTQLVQAAHDPAADPPTTGRRLCLVETRYPDRPLRRFLVAPLVRR